MSNTIPVVLNTDNPIRLQGYNPIPLYFKDGDDDFDINEENENTVTGGRSGQKKVIEEINEQNENEGFDTDEL